MVITGAGISTESGIPGNRWCLFISAAENKEIIHFYLLFYVIMYTELILMYFVIAFVP